MANPGYAYGLSAEVARKIQGKRDPAKEAEVKEWIEAICGPVFDGSMPFEKNLKDGRILCTLINTLQPGCVKKSSDSAQAFRQMENIERFLSAINTYGVVKGDLFQTVDLYNGTNIPQVTATLNALGRVCQGKEEWNPESPKFKNWPILGPKQSQENPREFDDATLIEGRKIIGIQAGTNKLASQSGQSFGVRRQVNAEEGPRS